MKPTTTKKPSFYRLQAYLSPEEKLTVERALLLLGRRTSLSGFATEALMKEARAIIEQQERNLPRRRKPPAATQAVSRPVDRGEGDPLLELVGAGERTFRELGGGEAFLKAERAAWNRPDWWEREQS